jgi:hypothetical protein
MRIRIASKSLVKYLHFIFNSRGYRTFGQYYAINFTLICSCPLLKPQYEKGNISVTNTYCMLRYGFGLRI